MLLPLTDPDQILHGVAVTLKTCEGFLLPALSWWPCLGSQWFCSVHREGTVWPLEEQLLHSVAPLAEMLAFSQHAVNLSLAVGVGQ